MSETTREIITLQGLQVEKETRHYAGDVGGIIYRLQTVVACEDRPLPWQRRGLQETATGYGRKLTTTKIAILPNGQSRRVYVTCFSNSGTAWIVLQGIRVLVDDYTLDTAEARHASI